MGKEPMWSMGNSMKDLVRPFLLVWTVVRQISALNQSLEILATGGLLKEGMQAGEAEKDMEMEVQMAMVEAAEAELGIPTSIMKLRE